jgi:hypothetical protein
MKVRLILGLAALIVTASIAPAARGGEFLHRRGPYGPAWNTNYYATSYGMPLAVVVPPNVRWQTNYAWGVGGTRLDRVGAQYQMIVPGPESVYYRGNFYPAPPQPTDTTQFGVNYVRGPRP